MQIDEILSKYKNTDSDINQHLYTLERLAQECNYVTEFGVRGGVSTAALLAGTQKHLVAFDINPFGNEQIYKCFAQEKNKTFTFIQENVLTTNKVLDTDLLFIDTLHSYIQLSLELFLHSDKVKKYIVCHDTVAYAHHNEGMPDLRTLSGMAGSKAVNLSVYPKTGLIPALNEFLDNNPAWRMKINYGNNNGLMVLERV